MHDVAIVGGGPAGSTAGSLLRKYDPSLRVVILEKAKFPREHVGESQLPAIGYVLDEMGCWDKVEAANFPIKVGATYRWGAGEELWDFEFLPPRLLDGLSRPGRYEGPRRMTAWQVDRAAYDTILLDHAAEMGCEVRQETRVAGVETQGDAVGGLVLEDGSRVEARWYLDASGHVGVIRRALGVGCTVPTKLMNVAFWDYWEDARWATTIGQGGTRVQVLSLGYGWVWFIPISPTRTSIGLICPASYYKECGLSGEELYQRAVREQPRVAALTKQARREGELRSTKDWSFVSDRLVGENWFLVGEAAGFADPILAGGLTLAHDSARAAAYIILELGRDPGKRRWLCEHYEQSQRKRVMQYIRFADYWYAANGCFTDLEGLSAEIAKDAGMKMSPKEAFRWLSLGGFNPEDGGRAGIGGLDLDAVKEVTGIFGGSEPSWEINKYNTFRLNLLGAKEAEFPVFSSGRVERAKCLRRGKQTLPLVGVFGIVVSVLKRVSHMEEIGRELSAAARQVEGFRAFEGMAALEAMLVDGWVTGRLDPRKPHRPYLPAGPDGTRTNFFPNRDDVEARAEGG